MYPKGSIAPGGDKDRALKLLANYPAGLHLTQICKATGLDAKRCADVMHRLGKSGMAASVDDSVAGAHWRKRWCLPEHLDACREAVRRSRAGSTKALAEWPRSPNGRSKPMHADVPSVPTPKFTPLPPDLRFTVAAPEPFFSRPGYRPDMLRTGSALEAAYGGGND